MTDWDKAYDNRAHVGDADEILPGWEQSAEAFRTFMLASGRCKEDIAYGETPRNRYDLFLPVEEPKGTIVYIHGGYWRSLNKSFFSHMSKGPLDLGWSVAIPSYTLAPEAPISQITREVALAITEIAKTTEGPIRIIGHSAGGHLVARMHCADRLLDNDVYERIENTVAVSGVFELDPLLKTKMNEDLRLDEKEVQNESPAKLMPRENALITCLVGGGELPEFLRQNDLLIPWREEGAKVKTVVDQGKHHFNVIEPLAEKNSLITMVLLS